MAEIKEVTVPNLHRGMAILELLATSQLSATIAELSERLGYPSASVFRITQELENLDYLSRDPVSKRYTITNKFLLLGQPQGRQKGLVEAVIPAMRALRKATGETTQICCLVEDKNVILEQLISNHPFKYSAELGARCPAYSCAPGKAIIANLPEEERKELVDRLRLKRFTPTTITTKQAFVKELEKIVASGFAVDHAEGMEGIHCVAAVVRDSKNYPIGSITIAGPSYRLPEQQFAEIGKVVMDATRQATASYCK